MGAGAMGGGGGGGGEGGDWCRVRRIGGGDDVDCSGGVYIMNEAGEGVGVGEGRGNDYGGAAAKRKRGTSPPHIIP